MFYIKRQQAWFIARSTKYRISRRRIKIVDHRSSYFWRRQGIMIEAVCVKPSWTSIAAGLSESLGRSKNRILWETVNFLPLFVVLVKKTEEVGEIWRHRRFRIRVYRSFKNFFCGQIMHEDFERHNLSMNKHHLISAKFLHLTLVGDNFRPWLEFFANPRRKFAVRRSQTSQTGSCFCADNPELLIAHFR